MPVTVSAPESMASCASTRLFRRRSGERGRSRGGRKVLCGHLGSVRYGLRIRRFKLQTELHGRIEEALDGAERNHEAFRNPAERQPDLEPVVRYHQIPELVLQDDRHLLRILRQQPRRQFYAFGG